MSITEIAGRKAEATGETRSAVLAITVGGVIAGVLDLTQACLLFGSKIPLVIAGGLLGRQAFHGGMGTYVLGVPAALLYRFLSSE